jgi:hypothetical protein
MPATDLTALRDALAAIIVETKQSTPPTHHAKLEMIATTLDTIPGDLIPDFVSLDATNYGAVSALLRSDIRSIADDGIMSSDITDAHTFVNALVIFIDAIRLNETEWIAHRVRRKLEKKPLYDA